MSRRIGSKYFLCHNISGMIHDHIKGIFYLYLRCNRDTVSKSIDSIDISFINVSGLTKVKVAWIIRMNL